MATNQPRLFRSDSEILRKYVLCSNAGCENRLSREVRLLPCLHPCCERCLNAVVNPEEEEEEVDGIKIHEENHFPCPKEGCERRIPHDYLQQNEPAQFHRWLGELVQNLQASDTFVRGEEPSCSLCESRPAVVVCRHRDCFDVRLCEYCERHHRENVKTKDHADDIIAKECLVEQLNADPPRGLRNRPLRCSAHNRKLRFYCKRTCELVCTSGMLTYHRPKCSLGECMAVEDFINDPDHMPKIEGLKRAVDLKCADLQRAMDGIKAIQRDLLQRKEDMEEQIAATKRQLMQEIEEQETELKEQVAMICNTKLRRLNTHSEKLAQIKKEIEQSAHAQFVTDFLDNYGPSPVEFFLLKDHIQPALEEIVGTYESYDFNCKEDATLNYNPNDGLAHVWTMGSISSSPDTENFVKDGPDIQLKAKKLSHVGVTCRDAAGGTPTAENMPPLRVRLVPNEDDLGAQPGGQDHPDAVNCDVTPHHSTMRYSISVLPPSKGPHCLWVYEDCPKPTGIRHIHGSPFRVQVQ